MVSPKVSQKSDLRVGRRLSHRFVALLVPLVTAAVRILPRWTFAPMAKTVAFAYHHSSRREMRILHQNLTQVLGLAPGSPEIRTMTRGIAYHQVISALETVRGIHRPGSVEIEGLDALTAVVGEMESGDRGQMLITAHLGSWELLAMCMAQVGERKFHCLAKRSKTPALTEFLIDLRERAGSGVLWIGGGSLLRQMLTTLKRGEWLGFAMDQKPDARRGPVVEFFGRDTEFVAGPAALAIRTGCPVLAAQCVREGPFRYRVLCAPVLAPDHGESDELELTQRLASEIEAAIRRYPEQWPWSYRRWYFDDEEDGTRVTVSADAPS